MQGLEQVKVPKVMKLIYDDGIYKIILPLIGTAFFITMVNDK